MPKIPDGLSDEERAYFERLTRPMPLRARRELDVCIEMDQFHAGLDRTRVVLEGLLARPEEISPNASPTAVQAAWRECMTELKVSFGKTDQHGLQLIRAIKVMLALE